MTPDRPYRRGRVPAEPWADPATGPGDMPLGFGRALTPDLLRKAYAAGVFPWYNPGEPVMWWSPDPRAVIELDGLHVSRRLARTIRAGKFRTTVNRAFLDVMIGCGENRPDGTWVHDEMVAAYTALHQEGDAHSVEVWAPAEYGPSASGEHQDATQREHPSPYGGGVDPAGAAGARAGELTPPGPPSLGVKGGDALPTLPGTTSAPTRSPGPPGHGWELVGGIYGVAVGGLFAGESMFHRRTDASKVALVALVERLRARGFVLFDVQMTTDHTSRMGAENIPRAEYLARLRKAVILTHVRFADQDPPPAGESPRNPFVLRGERMTRLVLTAVAALGASPAAAQEKLTAAQVIARVKENEARYDDLEVRYVRRLRDPDGRPGDPKSVSSETPIRSVRQKGMTRVESDSFSDGKKVADYRFRSAFDGTLTRLNWDGDRRDLARGARYDSDLFSRTTSHSARPCGRRSRRGSAAAPSCGHTPGRNRAGIPSTCAPGSRAARLYGASTA